MLILYSVLSLSTNVISFTDGNSPVLEIQHSPTYSVFMGVIYVFTFFLACCFLWHNNWSPWTLDLFASLQIHETLYLWTPHASAVRSWCFKKWSLLCSSSDTYFWKKLYTLKLFFESSYAVFQKNDQHHCFYFAYLRTCSMNQLGVDL
jgi:hypothetical protein